MVLKKGEMTFRFFISVFSFLLLVALLLIAFNSYSIAKNPQGLVPGRDSDPLITGNSITGYAVYTGEILTVSEIEEGVSLSEGWNTFVWPTDKNNPIDIEEAFLTILANTHFAYDYENQKYWFNPDGIYSSYNTHSYYSTVLFSKINPGKKYGVYLSENLVLRYDFGFGTGRGGDVTYEGVLDMFQSSCIITSPNGEISLGNRTTGIKTCENYNQRYNKNNKNDISLNYQV